VKEIQGTRVRNKQGCQGHDPSSNFTNQVLITEPLLISGLLTSINNLLWVFLWYFLDGNHALLVKVMSSVHNTIRSMSQRHAIASLVNIVCILIHNNTQQNRLSLITTKFYYILNLELMTYNSSYKFLIRVFKSQFQTFLISFLSLLNSHLLMLSQLLPYKKVN